MSDNVPAGHVVIHTTGFEELLQKINSAGVELKNTTGLLAAIAEKYQDSTARAFDSEKDPETGEPWADWSDSYVLHLQHIGKANHSKLQMSSTSGLKDSVQPYYTDNEAGIGSALPYARIHQMGFNGEVTIKKPVVTIRAHGVRASMRSAHSIKQHKVKAHYRTSRKGKTYRVKPFTVREHIIKAHKVRAHKVRMHEVKRHTYTLTVPARPYLGLDEPARKAITRLLTRFIEKNITPGNK